MILRLIIAVAALWTAFSAVDAKELKIVFLHIRLEYLLYMVGLCFVLIWATCVRWGLLIRASGHKVQMIHLIRYYTIGLFFNSFLPSYVGGDAARSFYLGTEVGSQKKAFGTTVVERFAGLLAMTTLSTVFVLCGAQATEGVELAVFIVTALTILGNLALLSESFGGQCISLVNRLIRLSGRQVFAEKAEVIFEKINSAFDFARSDSKVFLLAWGWSYVFHVLLVFNSYLAAKAIGWDSVEIEGLFVVLPLVLLISMVPLTPSGLGIQEGAFLFFLVRIGATSAEGLGVGIILRLRTILIAIVGAFLWTSQRRQNATQVLSSSCP
jgi:hypothetical protein